MEKIIKLLGFQEDVIVKKKRVKTIYQDIEIVLDEVEQLGEFIEAEKIVSEPDPEKRRKIQEELLEFLEKTGVPKVNQIIDGKYDIMLYEKLKNGKD